MQPFFLLWNGWQISIRICSGNGKETDFRENLRKSVDVQVSLSFIIILTYRIAVKIYQKMDIA